MSPDPGKNQFKEKLYVIIFESDTPRGKAFDVALLWTILFSLITVALESVSQIREEFGHQLILLEYFFTALFTIEYFIRLYCVRRPVRYAFSFYGMIDLLAILPVYIGFFIPAAQPFLVVRVLRLLRVFRVLKLLHFVSEAEIIKKALLASLNKIAVFIMAVVIILTIVASAMYVIEGPESGFTSIPVSLYWAIVTITTVGYGDIVPVTFFGRFLSNLVMILGYGMIAVPTGIVSVEFAQEARRVEIRKKCGGCHSGGHDKGAKFCKDCGESLI
ncbi:MAG: ion transporter [Cytophagaceae bacterium]